MFYPQMNSDPYKKYVLNALPIDQRRKRQLIFSTHELFLIYRTGLNLDDKTTYGLLILELVLEKQLQPLLQIIYLCFVLVRNTQK
jgi:hypothetical protein